MLGPADERCAIRPGETSERISEGGHGPAPRSVRVRGAENRRARGRAWSALRTSDSARLLERNERREW